MNINPASITLTRLSEDELQLCLLLLETPLHNRRKMSALVREIETYLFRTIPDRWKKRQRSEGLRNRLCVLHLARVDRKNKWVTGPEAKGWTKDLRDELWGIQSSWRGHANGLENVNPDIPGYTEDFDWHILATHEIKLPPLKFIPQLGSRQPLLTIMLNDVEDMFTVLFARAVSNFQLSRLARCIVCGHWELKARAGRRSRVKVKFCRKKNSMANFSKWPEFFRRIPHWPALCNRKTCRDRFANVAAERSGFREKDFPGILRKGMTQYPPKKITYQTERFPE